MQEIPENKLEEQPQIQSEPLSELKFTKVPRPPKKKEEALKEQVDFKTIETQAYDTAPLPMEDTTLPSLREVILNFVTGAPKGDWHLLNNILKIKFQKEYAGRAFAKTVRTVIAELISSHQMEASGHTHLNLPYWTTDTGLVSDGPHTRYQTLDDTNIFVRNTEK